MNGGPIERIVTHGVFELDGGSWEVDNNIWVVGNDSQVVGDPHPRTLPRVGMLACPRTGRRVLRRHPVRGRPRCHRPVLLRLPHHPRIHLEPARQATRRHRRLHRPRRLHHHRRRNHPLRRMGHPRPLTSSGIHRPQSWGCHCCCQQVDPCHAELLQMSRGVPVAHSAAGQLVFTSLAVVENKLPYCEFHQSDRGD